MAIPSPQKRRVLGQSSWRLATRDVEAFVTETGGHLGPVTFYRRTRKLRPYSVAPWAEEKRDPSLPPIINVLRGDFFCLPFGGNGTALRGEKHPVHGETANSRWRFQSLQQDGKCTTLQLSLRTRIRAGQVRKKIELVEGQNIVYCEHTISGMAGPMNPGHHAMLKFPGTNRSGVISTSRFIYGQVFPGTFESPESGGYSSLKPGAEFNSLERVPSMDGTMADLSRYPARRGFEDLVMIVHDTNTPFAWTAVTFPRERYVWFALKNPRLLNGTVFWISNGGRHYPPWSGRHVNVMGIEDVMSCFHYGLAESASRNALVRKGFATCHQLRRETRVSIPYIMGVATIPAGFDRVKALAAATDGKALMLRAHSGKAARVLVDRERLGALFSAA